MTGRVQSVCPAPRSAFLLHRCIAAARCLLPRPRAGAQLAWSAGNRYIWVSLSACETGRRPHSGLRRSDLRLGLDLSAGRAPPLKEQGPNPGARVWARGAVSGGHGHCSQDRSLAKPADLRP